MTPACLRLHGAEVLRPEGLDARALELAEGRIGDAPASAREVDLSGYLVLPGIVDVHGDGFERHVAPRRGALRDTASGLVACEAELAANGITTGVLAQFYSWEGGLRGPEFARALLEAWRAAREDFATDLRIQLRFETHMLDDYTAFEALVRGFGVDYVVFNDHLPHAALAQGKRPARTTAQALKSGRNPELYLALMQRLHERAAEVPAAVTALASRLSRSGVRLGSHDDGDARVRATWRDRGVTLSEFPESLAAAREAREGGDGIVLGAPNVMRGSSHQGNAAAGDLIAQGYCDALASDYHYPAPRLAALKLARSIGLARAWHLVSEGPARLLGLSDRGVLAPGMRADLVVMDPATGHVGATIAGGCVSYLAGPVAARFIAPAG